MTDREFWHAAFLRDRNRYIELYRIAIAPWRREQTRQMALHYGRLARKLRCE